MVQLAVDQIDPQWAWSPFTPSAEAPWDRARAAHLFRRAGFAANSRQLDESLSQSPSAAAAALVSGTEPAEFRREAEGLTQAMVNTGESRNLAAVWLYRMMATPHPLLEKMTLFWHGHFATSAEKVGDAALMQMQNELLRRHALGQFSQLVQEISRDPAMLIYLDSATNRKSHPNENYAREVMELFCLGAGNYTEQDIRELARCFTGWQVTRKRFRFNTYQHDFGEKTIFECMGLFRGEDAVRLILEQPSAPKFLARKLVRYFVFDEPAPPDALIEPLAQELRANDFQVAPVVRRILGSQLFFSDFARGRKIRSPVELACGLLRALEATANTFELAEQLDQLGQGLFYPPNVKGWDGGRAWINSSTLLGRANLVHGLLNSEKTRFAGGTLSQLADRHGVNEPPDLVAWLEQLLLAVPIPLAVRQQLVEVAAGHAGGQSQRAAAVVHALSALPEFQLS